MENLYAIDCDFFPKNKIIEVLRHYNFHFLTDKPKPGEDFVRYISFSEDKIWFTKRAVVLNNIIIGTTFREDTNRSAFEIYFPNQNINPGFNYNPEFSKKLISMSDLVLNSSIPIIAINLHNKKIDSLLSEDDITFENTEIRTSRRYKSVSFEVTKEKGIKKLFLYKRKDFFIVIGWVLQGRRNRNTVIYNKNFTDFLMQIESIDLKAPKGFENYKIDNSHGENKHIQGDNLVNPLKISQRPEHKKKLYFDHTPKIDKINVILEKINRSGLDSLYVTELLFLKNNSGNI